MSEKTGKHAAEYIFFAIAAIQTIIAIVWLFGNINTFTPDTVSLNYLEASKSLVVDDQMGIFYALVSKLSFCLPVLYAVQAVCVAAAFVYACIAFDISILFALFLASSPFVVQSFVAIRPSALFVAFAALAVAGVKKLFETEKKRYAVMAALSYLFMGLLEPAFIILGFVCLLVPSLLYYSQRKKSGSLFLLLTIIFFGAGFLIKIFVSTPGAYGRAESSFGLLLMQRVVWPKNGEFIFFLPDNIEDALIEETALADKVPETLFTHLAPKIKTLVGNAESESVFFGYTVDALKISYKSIVFRMFSQYAYYVFMPLSVLFIYLFNIKDTYVPGNILSLIGETPAISKIFISIYVFALVWLVSYAVASRFLLKEKAGKTAFRVCAVSIIVLAFYGFFHKGPCFDPSEALGIFLMWMLMLGGIVFKRRER